MMGLIDNSNISCFLHRVTLAMFGYLPLHVDDSLTNLLIYTALPVEVMFDSKGAKKSDMQMIKYNFFNWVKYVFILGLYLSLLQAYDYQPYPNVEGPALQDIKLGTGFSHGQLINNILGASKCARIFISNIDCFMWRLLIAHHFLHSTIPDSSDNIRLRSKLHCIIGWNSTHASHA